MTGTPHTTMNDSDRLGESTPEPERPPSSTAPPARHEKWLDRVRAAIGLKGPKSIRTDLAAALASDEITASFTPEERAMLANILRLREMRVEDVMVPRADIDAVDVTTPLSELLVTFRESGHSRMPVYRDNLDDPIGMVHIKDLMGYVTEKGGERRSNGGLAFRDIDLSRPLSEAGLVRNVLFVPPSMPVAVLLANMQASRMQMALVIDEYGGTDGLVSLEDARRGDRRRHRGRVRRGYRRR